MEKAAKHTSQVFVMLGFVLSFALAALTLVGCSSAGQSSSSSSQASSPESESASSEQSGDASPIEGNGKTLMVYFSASGNTERVAERIAADTGADTFVITPTEPYTSDDLNWNQKDSRVNYEHDNESARNIALAQVTPDNFADYDTVFIGYPIWWGIAAWPVDGFVSGNNWEGKTVIPFCTSTSSGLGQSAELLEQSANGGTWLEGMRFASSANDATIDEWVASLSL